MTCYFNAKMSMKYEELSHIMINSIKGLIRIGFAKGSGYLKLIVKGSKLRILACQMVTMRFPYHLLFFLVLIIQSYFGQLCLIGLLYKVSNHPSEMRKNSPGP